MTLSGEEIRVLRTQFLRVRLQEFAGRLGVSLALVNHWESGIRTIQPEHQFAIIKAFKLDELDVMRLKKLTKEIKGFSNEHKARADLL